MRQPNAIDFWRGFALITIFINHVPGTVFVRATYSQYSLSDAAELFVFLAGWALALAVGRRPDGTRESGGRVLLRLTSRLVDVYRAQIVITALALAMSAAAALHFQNPVFLEWHNAGPVFADPVQASIGLALLTHQLGYFNILPLYVALLALACFFVMVARANQWLALALSLALYLASLVFELNLPTWPVEGRWFFNPLAWQLLLLTGYLACEWTRHSESFRLWVRRLLPLGLAGVAIGAIVAGFDLKPDPLRLPEPRLLFMFDKSNLSPVRFVHFVLVLIAFRGLYAILAPRLPWLARHFSALGRNSLAVFSVGSIVSLAGQLLRFSENGGILLDIAILAVGLAALGFTAWFVEWRARPPRSSSPR